MIASLSFYATKALETVSDVMSTPLFGSNTLGSLNLTKGRLIQVAGVTALIGLSALTHHRTWIALGLGTLVMPYLVRRLSSAIDASIQREIHHFCAESNQAADQRILFIDSENFTATTCIAQVLQQLQPSYQSQYCFQYTSVRSLEEVIKTLRSSDKKIALLWIQAHGNPSAIALGTDQFLVTHSDRLWNIENHQENLCEDALETCQPVFHDSSVVVLFGCSTGHSDEGIAHKIADVWKTKVIAPKEIVRPRNIVFGDGIDRFDLGFYNDHGDITAQFDGQDTQHLSPSSEDDL